MRLVRLLRGKPNRTVTSKTPNELGVSGDIGRTLVPVTGRDLGLRNSRGAKWWLFPSLRGPQANEKLRGNKLHTALDRFRTAKDLCVRLRLISTSTMVRRNDKSVHSSVYSEDSLKEIRRNAY